MPDPTTVHVDAALTGVSVAFRNNEFVADAVAPPVAVRRQSDRYFVLDPERAAQRETVDHRAPGAEAREVDFAVSTDSYYCDDHALETAIPDEERDNADNALQPDIDRTEFLTEKILLNREIGLEALLRTSTAVPEIALESGEEWTNSDSDPLGNFHTARQMIHAGSQRRANTVVMGYGAFDALRNHPRVVERVLHAVPGVVTADLLAAMLDVDRVLVARAMKNTSVPGNPPQMEPVWGACAFMLHVPPRAGLRQVAAVHTFVWNGAGGGAGRDGTLVERWREERRKADMIRVQKYYDQKLVAPGAAVRLAGVV